MWKRSQLRTAAQCQAEPNSPFGPPHAFWTALPYGTTGLFLCIQETPAFQAEALDICNNMLYGTTCCTGGNAFSELHGLVQESMRMLPVLTGGTNRTTAKPTKLGPVTVPAGTMVWIPFSALFNSPHNWEAPDIFNPVCKGPCQDHS